MAATGATTASAVPVFGGKVETYLEKLDSYYAFHGTKPDKKKHVLIMGLSEEQYETLACLTAPRKPKEVDAEDLIELLRRHYGATMNKMMERAKFREVKRSPSESVSEFVLKLRSQARTCEFQANLEENLLEQFRIGVNSKTVRDRISAMPADRQADLSEVVAIARQVEIEEKLDSMSVTTPPAVDVSAVRKQRRHGKKSSTPSSTVKKKACFRCMSEKHLSSSTDCPALHRNCNTCHKKGYFAGSKFSY
ncbi:uncharacterized protein [Watersipora subatra]|uniref:uncharacterized protein n=1 Tax=Watersipora subatra TaxID=2589382 RepID=UPI00355BBA0D